VARDGTRTAVEVSRFDTARQRYVAVPIDISGNRDPVYLTLFGTGFRGATEPPGVTIAGQDVDVESSRPAEGFHGVDQLVVGPVSGSAQGRILEIVATVDGRVSNAVTIAIK